ncbi:hypothetical protein CYMTET_5699 [Cymbomonas tetramitiformis]|uniref:Uncharacterized protein n=1 Tax=Cymbomonas tetramitiformis TaxID=36881 RepID=A0AAE0F3H8_9CHLO|nr:hypothetical protein CYMTET_40463 [Cymbomonas tetramitiformis]KAK3251395.1 hypothetical protein CYMTET_39261 [Cymbomonas tetramitiformis]KAK3273973.1 hypothetical protein CYMTET_17819 [Cymbomonas tetramitiformis]KAK3286760.1 hypothetical protein CYMTET_5699 [Cymbomonas tetramitiformis]
MASTASAAAAKRKKSVQSALPCEIVKKYPGQQQVDLNVKIDIPGHWFNGMSAADKARSFAATAVEYGNGNAGEKNPSLQLHIKGNSTQSRSFHTSVLSSQRLINAQRARGVKKTRCKRVFKLHRIRWGVYTGCCARTASWSPTGSHWHNFRYLQ